MNTITIAREIVQASDGETVYRLMNQLQEIMANKTEARAYVHIHEVEELDELNQRQQFRATINDRQHKTASDYLITIQHAKNWSCLNLTSQPLPKAEPTRTPPKVDGKVKA